MSFMAPRKERMGAAIKAVVLALFVIAAVLIIQFTPVKEFLTAERIGLLLANAGFLAPLMFIVVYAVGVCLFVPG
ncbi:MAG TPA: TVP38/TMEM64 family protein, partial [Syntrophobacteraceae bacterium]|nr:TVP38/TMEM64 family protein [Syntrophobacteraceae bacterium]